MDHHNPSSSSSMPIPHFFTFPTFITTTKKKTSQALLLSLFFFTSIIVYHLLTPQSHLLDQIGFLSKIIPTPPRTQDLFPKSSTCDYSYGEWVWDESYSREKYTENCSFLDPGFRCHANGRLDLGYQNWRWKPYGCDLPRFDASDLLERSRNSRIVFAGDSIARNQWESFLCMLAQGVNNKSSIYEESGNPISKHRGYLSMRFQEFNLTVEYYRDPFLVTLDRPPVNAPKEVKGVVRLDKLHWFAAKWVGADVIIFSAGHWWNDDKTTKMGIYFQEGEAVNMTMHVKEAFHRSLKTLASWVTQNLKPRTHVIFRSYSPVHYRNGTWKLGGYCHTSTAPETDRSNLEGDPINNIYISDIVKQMKEMGRNVSFLNITYMTEIRKDGHPSNHREPGTPADSPQDCSHWCLPGVPDSWNELIYAHLLFKGFRTMMD